MHWWTDSERGHLAFAASPSDLLVTARAVFGEHPYAEVKTVLEVEVVAPTARMCHLAAYHDRVEAVDSFYYEVLSAVQRVMEAGRKLPAPFAQCSEYAPGEDTTVDEWTAERHYGCENCLGRVKLVGMIKDGLYAEYFDRWRAAHPRHEYKPRKGTPQRVPSTADQAADQDELWYARGNFGDHAGGVELHEVDLSRALECRPSCLGESTLFFFRPLDRPEGLLAEVREMAREAQRAHRAVRKAEERARNKEREVEERAEVAATVAFFKEKV